MAKKNAQSQSKLLTLVSVGLALVVAGVFGPDLWQKYARARDGATRARGVLEQVLQARDAYVSEKNAADAVLKQARAAAANGDLWTTVNRAVQETSLGDRAKLNTMASVSPSVSKLQLDLTGVSLQELVDLIYKVYKGNSMAVVEQLQTLTASKENKGLDCRMTLLAPKV